MINIKAGEPVGAGIQFRVKISGVQKWARPLDAAFHPFAIKGIANMIYGNGENKLIINQIGGFSSAICKADGLTEDTSDRKFGYDLFVKSFSADKGIMYNHFLQNNLFPARYSLLRGARIEMFEARESSRKNVAVSILKILFTHSTEAAQIKINNKWPGIVDFITEKKNKNDI